MKLVERINSSLVFKASLIWKNRLCELITFEMLITTKFVVVDKLSLLVLSIALYEDEWRERTSEGKKTSWEGHQMFSDSSQSLLLREIMSYKVEIMRVIMKIIKLYHAQQPILLLQKEQELLILLVLNKMMLLSSHLFPILSQIKSQYWY